MAVKYASGIRRTHLNDPSSVKVQSQYECEVGHVFFSAWSPEGCEFCGRDVSLVHKGRKPRQKKA